jgi:hypothetical protein
MGTLAATTIEDRVSGDNTPVLNTIHGSAKAWVNFTGYSTVTIRDSYNVSSITDNGTGDYTINFITGFSNANYSHTYAIGDDTAYMWAIRNPSKTLSVLRITSIRQYLGGTPVAEDLETLNLTCFGDQ